MSKSTDLQANLKWPCSCTQWVCAYLHIRDH